MSGTYPMDSLLLTTYYLLLTTYYLLLTIYYLLLTLTCAGRSFVCRFRATSCAPARHAGRGSKFEELIRIPLGYTRRAHRSLIASWRRGE